MLNEITLKLPASSGNLGPGFDCLALAIDIWNSTNFSLGSAGIEIFGEGAGDIPTTDENLIFSSFAIPFNKIGIEPPSVKITCHNSIPVGRGLGSSSASVISGLLAGNEMSGRSMTYTDILDVAHGLEGHADNSAASLYGGLQIVVGVGSSVLASSVNVPDDLLAVVYLPHVTVTTGESRRLLTEEVSRNDVVFNMSRVALLVNSFVKDDFTHLNVATEDKLHQPARQTVFPAMKNIIKAALDAGALGAFLSGGGSGVMALTRGREMTIGYEMAEAADKSGIAGNFIVTKPTNEGACIV